MYAEIQRASYCLLLKPKIPKYRGPNGRDAQASSITINFTFKLGRGNLFKSKKCMFKLFFTLTQKFEFLPTAFAVISIQRT